MSFHTAAGTRGRRKMRVGPVGRLVVRRITNTARRRRGRFMGMNVLVLHTVGAKSSKDRVHPVSWFTEGQDATPDTRR
jgi:F420H(2)-dependent quinone reductase